ncbi:MAG: VCBS repeat-containing protein, partial [Acidimicrobiia bacterium]
MTLAPAVAGAADTPDEVGFVDPATGLWNLGADESFFFGVPGDIPFLGDWYGTGVDTPGLYRPSNGFAYIIDRRETGIATDSWFMGIPGDIPIAGDWDGDGTDTFSVYRPSEGKVYINNFNETLVAQAEYYFGVPQDKPFALDFNGDGTDDIGLHRESTGLVYMTDATTGGLPDGGVAATDLEFFWGIPDDAVFAGDWTGNGVDSPGLVRPTLARTFLRYENSQDVADEDWPAQFADWMPVVAGVLQIVSGVCALIGAGLVTFGTAILHSIPDVREDEDVPLEVISWMMGSLGLFLALLAVVGIVGGIFAVRRRGFGWAMAGSIASLFTLMPLGLAALILV